MKRAILKTFLGAVVTTGTLVFLVPLVDFGQIRTAFFAADMRWVVFGFLAYAITYVARAVRFGILLPQYTISFLSIFRITSIHGASVRIFPNPLGELAFIGGTKREGVKYASSVSALVAYRALDFVTISLFLFIGSLLLIPSIGNTAYIGALIGSVIAALAVGIIVIASFYQAPLVRLLDFFERRFPVRGPMITTKGMLLIDALRLLREERVYLKAIIASICVWLCMFISYGAFFKAVGVTTPILILVVAGTVQILVNTAPNVAGVGVMEAGWIAGFALGGIPSSDVLAGAIFVDLATLLGTIILGCVGLLLMGNIRPKDTPRSKKHLFRKTIIAFALIGSILGALFFFREKLPDPVPERVRFFETYPDVVVQTTWVAYRSQIQKDGRTIDRDRDFVTTSEGQSYSLLRAVWMDDKETFDRVLKWTDNNLGKRPNDDLFAWLWGKNSDGSWNVISEKDGMNTASDADQDIALALIFAGKRWNNDDYTEKAQKILSDIWQEEVVIINERPYLVAGNWAKDEVRPTINPSYFSFAAYPIFAEIDPTHPWMLLKETSYEVLNTSTKNPLDEKQSVGIPSDWISIDPTTGEIMLAIHADKTSHFSDDAFRVLWRVALDWQWHKDPRAYEYLSQMNFFEREWNDRHTLSGIYAHDGKTILSTENNSIYAVIASSFSFTRPEFSREVFNTKVAPLYNPDTEDLVEGLGYYAQNWVWFGTAMYTGNTPNLSLAN